MATVSTRGIATRGSGQQSVAAGPNVCKTPSPVDRIVPIPYANMIDARANAGNKDAQRKQKELTEAAHKEGYDAQSATQAAIKSNGDEAGTTGGIKSATITDKSYFNVYGLDVKVEGTNVVRVLSPLSGSGK